MRRATPRVTPEPLPPEFLRCSRAKASAAGSFRQKVTKRVEVPPCELDQALGVALFVRASDLTEVVLVEMMRLQTEEFACRFFATAADDPGHGDLRVVVADPVGHAPEEFERTDVALLERLGAFTREGLAEEGVAVRQRHHAEHHLNLTATVDGPCLAEVELGFARRVRQRHEDFGRLLLERRISSRTTVIPPV